LPKDKEKRHNNVIFSARFQPDSENLIYSGGWDRQVKFWDVRANQQTNCFFGPQVCGDSLDMHKDGRLVVTGGGSGGEGI
jgi:WD40 repeat protein